MSSSLYCAVKRDKPLSSEEWKEIEKIVSRYNDDNEVRTLVMEGGGELFSISRPTNQAPVILKGSTKLPGQLYQENIFDFMIVVEAWLHLMSDIRNFIPDGVWEARLDDQALYWNPSTLEYEHPQ